MSENDFGFVLRRAGHIGLLALLIWREVRNESYACQVAVGHTVIARAAHGGFGDGILGVIGQGNQYSSLTHVGDVQLVRFPKEDDLRWLSALRAANDVLTGEPSRFPNALYYHDNTIEKPHTKEWLATTYVGTIDRILFYNG